MNTSSESFFFLLVSTAPSQGRREEDRGRENEREIEREMLGFFYIKIYFLEDNNSGRIIAVSQIFIFGWNYDFNAT